MPLLDSQHRRKSFFSAARAFSMGERQGRRAGKGEDFLWQVWCPRMRGCQRNEKGEQEAVATR